MASINLTFCKGKPQHEPGMPVPQLDYSTAEDVTIGASSTASTGTAPAGCFYVRIYAEAACRVGEPGSAPTALAASPAIGAGVTDFRPCQPGDKVAVIEF